MRQRLRLLLDDHAEEAMAALRDQGVAKLAQDQVTRLLGAVR